MYAKLSRPIALSLVTLVSRQTKHFFMKETFWLMTLTCIIILELLTVIY